MAIINNVYLFDSQNNKVFLGNYDDQWLGIEGTPEEFWSLATEEQVNNFLLPDIKNAKINEIRKIRLTLQYSNITFNAIEFYANQQAQEYIKGKLINLLSELPKEASFIFAWQNSQNQIIQITYQNLIDLSKAIELRTQSLIWQEGVFFAEVGALQTAQEVQEYKYQFKEEKERLEAEKLKAEQEKLARELEELRLQEEERLRIEAEEKLRIEAERIKAESEQDISLASNEADISISSEESTDNIMQGVSEVATQEETNSTNV